MKQTARIGVSGSFFNQLMGNNSSEPKVGEGATKLMYSDRRAYTVTWVSDDKLKCKIRACKAIRTDDHGMSDSQEYRYEETTDREIDLVYRNGAWRYVNIQVVYVKEMQSFDSSLDAIRKTAWDEKNNTLKVVKGVTRIQTTYPKVSIIFGVRREYYDYSF